MSKILGKITLFIFIIFFFLEFFSLIATKFNLLRFNDIPIYSFKEVLYENSPDTVILVNGGVFNKDIEEQCKKATNIQFIFTD